MRMSAKQRLVKSILTNNAKEGNINIALNLQLLQLLGSSSAIVYSLMANHTVIHADKAVDNCGWIYFDQKYIMRNTGFGRSCVIDAIQKLERYNLIEKKLDRRESSFTHYRVMGYAIEGDDIKVLVDTWDEQYLKNKLGLCENQTCSSEDSAFGEQAESGALKNLISSKRIKAAPADFDPDEQRTSKRRSKVKPVQNTVSKRRKYSEREYQFSKILVDKILRNHPNAFSPVLIDTKVEQGAEELHKLVHKYKYTFTFVKDCLTWAIEHPFWKRQIQSVRALSEPSKKNGNIKFENIAVQYNNTLRDPEQDFDTDVTDAINEIIQTDEYYQDCDVDVVHNECSQFFQMLEELSKSISPARNRFYWHKDAAKFIEALRWGLKMDGDVIGYREITCWVDVVSRYILFLQNLLQRGSIDKIHAGMFSSKSVLFNDFINDLSAQWQRRILESQVDDMAEALARHTSLGS